MPIPVAYPTHPSNADPPVECSDCGVHFTLGPSGSGGTTDGMACPECGGLRLFRSQPGGIRGEMDAPGGTLRDMVDSDSQKDQGGNPLGEGTIMGREGEQRPGKRDNFMHGNTSVTERVVSRTSNMEPYDALFHESGLWDTLKNFALPAAETAGMVGLNILQPETIAADPAAEAAIAGAAVAPVVENAGKSLLQKGVGMAGNAVKNQLGKAPGTLMKNVLGIGGGAGAGGAAVNALEGGGGGAAAGAAGGGNAAGGLTPAPNQFTFGSTDIPMLMLADFETALSVPSVDEQHDNPEDQDQKQFHDGDHSPSNMRNPNLEDSGAMGEDNARSDSSNYTGFAENSPGIKRMNMMMPLLMHYHDSPESGENDPMIRALHETLEKESPGYLNHEEPEGEGIMQQLLMQHKQPPHGVHAGVNMQPGAPAPGAAQGVPGVQQLVNQQQQGMGGGTQGNGMGACPQCGGAIGPDGSCPTCGQTAGSDLAPGPGAIAPGAPGPAGPVQGQQGMPPMMAAHFGMTHMAATSGVPVTPEQIAAVQQHLVDHGRAEETPNVELHPEQYGKELAEIQQQQNVAPQVDPSQVVPPQMPQAPQGAMPMPDPSQAGGGSQMPMQPMSSTKKADANNSVRRCPKCNSSSTSVEGLGDNTQDGSIGYAKCHACQNPWSLKMNVSHSIFADLVDLPNPVNHPMLEGPQMVWKDTNGEPLQEGATYEIHSPAFSVPDTVKVTRVKGDQLDLQLADGISMGGSEPDFKVSRKEAQLQDYKFVLVSQKEQSTEPDMTPGTAPSEVAPVETTDSGPADPHTSVASVHTANDPDNDWHCKSCLRKGNDFPLPAHCPECDSSATIWNDDPDDDPPEQERSHESCRKCGSTMVDDSMSSPDITLHECVPCGAIWETRDEFAGRESGVDLSWLNEDNNAKDFHADMERAQAMAAVGTGSRNIGDISARDPRLMAIKGVLAANGKQRIAGKSFTTNEKHALIDEYGVARNLDDLDLDGTHYESRFDLTGKASGDSVNPAHMVLGIPN